MAVTLDESSTPARRSQRLVVNLDRQAADALRDLAESRGITVTDALRRAIALERFLNNNSDKELLLRDREGVVNAIVRDDDRRGAQPGSVDVLGHEATSREPRKVALPEAGLLGADGRAIRAGEPAGRRLLLDVREVSAELLGALARKPADLLTVTPRRFEEIVAELLTRRGYAVTVTPAQRDGGRDLLVAKNDDLGSFLYLVECKRNAPANPVGVDVVRRLYGVVAASQATAGMVATTSRFTAGSKALQAELRYQMALRDFEDLATWLRAYRTGAD